MPATQVNPASLVPVKQAQPPAEVGSVLDAIHDASKRDQAVVNIQQAAAFAEYLEGGEHFDTVTSEHHMGNAEAADNVRDQLRMALELLGVEA